MIPYATEQGINSCPQGIYSGFGPEQGIRRKTDPLAPTHRWRQSASSSRIKEAINEQCERSEAIYHSAAHWPV
jgi:hypothetical protein